MWLLVHDWLRKIFKIWFDRLAETTISQYVLVLILLTVTIFQDMVVTVFSIQIHLHLALTLTLHSLVP